MNSKHTCMYKDLGFHFLLQFYSLNINMRFFYSLTDTTGCLAVWQWTMCMKTLGSFALCPVPIPVRYMSWIKVQLMRVHAGVSSLSSSMFSQLIFWYISNGIGTCTNGCFNWKVCFITNLIMYWFNWVIGFRIWDRFFIYFFFFSVGRVGTCSIIRIPKNSRANIQSKCLTCIYLLYVNIV